MGRGGRKAPPFYKKWFFFLIEKMRNSENATEAESHKGYGTGTNICKNKSSFMAFS